MLTFRMLALHPLSKIRKRKSSQIDATAKKAQPKAQQTFRTTAISDITLPDMNELDVKDLAPVVEAAPPTMSDAGMNNNAMKSALKGIGLSLPKTIATALRSQEKRIERLRSGGGERHDRSGNHERLKLAGYSRRRWWLG